MKNPNHPARSYKFNFIKDRFWMWALCLPIGIICWAIPFIILFGLMNTKNSPQWFPYFGFIFLGIPSYLVGWIFVYSFMEGILTKVTIADNLISIRLPWLIFPIIPVKKSIGLDQIHRVDLFAPYGSRTAVFLYYMKNGKERRFYIPKFKYDAAYMDEIIALQKRIEYKNPPPAESHLTAIEALKTRNQPPKAIHLKRPLLIDRLVYSLTIYTFIGIVFVSAWISSTIPSGGIEVILIGFSMGFAFSMLGFVGQFPVIGQALIWFFGRWVITTFSKVIFNVETDTVLWSTPESIDKILAQFSIEPVHASFTEFLFWSILVFSILISLGSTMGWLRRWVFMHQKTGTPDV